MTVPDKLQSRWLEKRSEHWLSKGLADSLAEVFATLGVEGVRVETGAGQEGASAVWWRLPLELAPDAAVYLGGDQATVEAAGAILTDAAEQGETILQELLQQAGETLAQTAARETEQAVVCGAIERTDTQPEKAAGVELVFELEGATHRIIAAPNDALLAALFNDSDKSEQGGALTKTEQAPPFESRNLGLLLDVELDLSGSFGETELPLDDVLQLCSGSIVELRRAASDPVDILVNGQVIARGEVVVVDGNYGVRITEVASRQDRMLSIL